MAAYKDYLLISEQDVKDLTPSNINIGHTVNTIEAIRTSQADILEAVLGCTLYEELLEQASTSTLTPANQTLIDRATRMIAYASLVRIIEYTNAQIRETGVVQLTGTNYQRDDKAYSILVKRVTTDAEAERSRFERWLCKNGTEYPTWWSSDYFGGAWYRGLLDINLYQSRGIQPPPPHNSSGVYYVGGIYRHY